MNYAILSHIIYFTVNTIIIYRIGKLCYKHGLTFTLSLTGNNKQLSFKINQLLLIGYYLLNIGYCATTIIQWPPIINLTNLVEVVSLKTAQILLIIGVLHHLNLLTIIKFINTKF